MHEFSLATGIIDIVESSAAQAGKSKVNLIELEIGELSGVEEQALFTALDSLTQNTSLEKAKIITRNKKGIALCTDCKLEFRISDMFTLCPECSGFNKEILSGKEFNVLSIEAE